MHEVTAYQCDSCGKVLKYKSSAVRHEKHCKHNPAVKACATCRYQDREVVGDGGFDEQPYEYVVPICNSSEAAEDEEFCFDNHENPHFIVRNCQHWEQRETNDTATN
jgi:hypothetical protein